ncbi:MAG TPA: DUF2589 domain-containing protein [Candidatus Anaerobiospirillum stercoravium]|nr:DUF2589 domain-containing protein [Candidatus Anaerobiospirillum stercoravium]
MSEIANQFSGLPMADLIGGPLQAACDAQVSLANATADFIRQVGFNEDGSEVKMVSFSFARPGQGAIEGPNGTDYGQETVKMNVPLLTLVNTPALAIKRVNITFDMEVKNSTSEKSSNDKSAKLDAEASFGFGCFKAKVNISGSISAHQEHTRTSDTSAKYHVEVFAEDSGMPEGMHRLYDILQSAISPEKITYQGGGAPAAAGGSAPADAA